MPPHNSASSSDHPKASTKTEASKLVTDCSVEQRNSLQCIQDHLQDKQICQPFFEAYKKCRAEENRRRLEENARKYSFW